MQTSNRQLMLLRLLEPAERHAPLQLHCWCNDGWRPVALDDDFARAFDPDCSPVENPGNAIALQFPEGAQALLLLPGSWVWSGLETIPRAARRQTSALGYMVEDQLAEDVEDLHFVCQPQSGDLCSIYAISREKMDALSAQVRRLQWPVTAAVPEYQLLNAVDADISLWFDGNRAHLWRREGRGLSLSRQYLRPLLETLQAGEVESEPHRLHLLGDVDELILAELRTSFGERLSQADGAAEEQLLARCKSEQLANLLAGEYRCADESDERQWWRKPAIALAACFVAQLVFFLAAGGYYQWRASSAEAEAREIFAQLFPQVGAQENLRRQIEGYLNQAGGGSGGFGRQLQLLSGVWGQHKGGELRLQSLRFDGNRNEMVLQLQAANLADLDTLVGKLSNGEYRAELLAANELDKGVSGRIRLR